MHFNNISENAERGLPNDINDILFENVTCHQDQWQCDNAECIDIKFVCNGYPDCSDRSDESVYLCKLTGKLL